MNIVNGSTSSTITDALVLISASGQPITNVASFDTSTLTATLSGGGSSQARVFYFAAETVAEVDSLATTLDDADLKARIRLVRSKAPKRAMDAADTGTTEVLEVIGTLSLILVECSACNTKFAACTDSVGKLWTINKANAADKLFTATEIDTDTLQCDNCSAAVSIFSQS